VEGLFGVVAPGTKIVLHSTIGPATCRRLAAQGAERGVAVLDAGMTGAATLAERGELTLLVGGDVRLVEECRAELGVGQLGEGQVHGDRGRRRTLCGHVPQGLPARGRAL